MQNRIKTLGQWMFDASHLVVFTGAGISTESGLPDFRGPDGLWTRQAKGLPAPKFDWTKAVPNQAHMAIVELQNMGKLTFLISQNVDNLHLKSGIRPQELAEVGNAGRYPAHRLRAFTLGLGADTISCQGIGECSHHKLLTLTA